MANANLTGVTCPVCGESVDVRAIVDPGQPPSGLSGPPEFSDPGYGPSVDEVEEIEYNCDCRENIESNAPSQKHPKEKDGVYYFVAQRLEIVWGYDDGRNYGPIGVQPGNLYVHKQNPQYEYKVDERGRRTLVFVTTQPLLDTYDAEIERQIDNAEIEVDEWEPYYDEDRYDWDFGL